MLKNYVRGFRCFVPLFALCFASCAISKSPLSPMSEAKFDESMFGVWVTVSNGQLTDYYHIGSPRIDHAKGEVAPPDGVGRLVTVTHELKGVAPLYDNYFFVTRLDGKTYINAIGTPPTSFKFDGKQKTDYFIYRYETRGDRASLWFADGEFIKDEIRVGKIKGQFDTLTDSTENLAKWMKETSAKVFPDENKIELKRLAAP